MTKKDGEHQALQAKWTLEQVQLIEAELNKSGGPQTGTGDVRGMKRPRPDEDNKVKKAVHNRSIKKQKRHMGGSGSSPDLSSRSQGRRLTRSHDETRSDEPPAKHPGGSQESGASEARRVDGDEVC